MSNFLAEAAVTSWLRLMNDERRGWRTLTAVAAVLAICKGLRFPNFWSATQLQLGYQFGIVKRGGATALLQLSGLPIQHYWVFAAFSFAALGVVIYLCALFIRRNAVTQEAIALAPVFVSSFAVTYLVSMVGYVDLILIALLLLQLTLPQANWTRALDYVVCVAALLVHEEFIITFFPVIWLSRVLETMRPEILGKPAASHSRIVLVHVIALPIVVVIGTFTIALYRPLSAAEVLQARASIGAIVDFPLRDDFFDVMQRSLADNFRIMLGKYHTFGWWIDEFGATFSLLWIGIFFAWRALRFVSTIALQGKLLLNASILGTCFAPVLMQLVGWDIYRWYAVAAFTSFATYLLVVRAFASSQPLTPVTAVPHIKTLVLLLIGLNLSTGAGLFDGYRVNTFPFVDGIRELLRDYSKLGYVPIPHD